MKLTSRQIALGGALAAFSSAVQLVHIGYQSPQWGMWLDLVAVSWIAAFFLFGTKISLIVSLLGTIVITFFSPDTWLGASMKFTATLPLIFTLSLHSKTNYSTLKKLILPVILALIIRSLLVVPLNYYYALPIWTGMTPATAIKVIPWYVIAAFNSVQLLIDVSFAWILVYRFRLNRYARN
ncbi:MAG: hypothetical protein NTZ93_01485 [Candidatus Beckwithbacteria bacterium]|nr:hypothetical protein [Candidatus Beckwithbacteria bacterium]